MVKEVTEAIVSAINGHQDTVVTGLVGIAGTLVGAIGTILLEWFRNRGSVEFAIIQQRVSTQGQDSIGGAVPVAIKDAKQVKAYFELRALNRYPTPKTVALLSCEFYPARRRWRHQDPVITARYVAIGLSRQDMREQDIDLPADGFTRIYITATGDVNQRAAAPHLSSVRALRLTFLIAPAHRLYFWHNFELQTTLNDGGVS